MALSHRKLSAWYAQLAQQLESGLPFTQALRLARGTGMPSAGLEGMATTIESGGSVDAALRAGTAWLPPADVLALSAAAEAGRMPRTLRNLSVRHGEIGAAQLRLMLACVYPLGVLHFGLLLLPVLGMIDWEKGFQWSTPGYLRQVALSLGPLWALVIATSWLVRRGNPAVLAVARALPAIGGYMRAQALADFAFALGNLLEAGVPIGRAWATAGAIARSRDLQAAARAMEQAIAQGSAPGPQLAAWPVFPPDFVALYVGGETTGQLEPNLLRLATLQQDAANRALTQATLIYPTLLFFGVAGMVIYQVTKFYGAYLKMIQGML